MQYLGSNSNLNLTSTINLLQDHINVFIVYALKSKNATQNETSLFKINDKETSTSQITDYYGISFHQNKFCVGNAFPYEANGLEVGKLVCISLHWEQNNLGNPKHGKLFVNGKEIHSFYTNFKRSYNASKFYLGSKSSNYGQFDGEIFYVYTSSRKMKDKEIVLNHYLFCKKFDVDFDEEEIVKFI